MSHPLFDQHRETLQGAVTAIRSRAHWTPYPELPSGKFYGEAARDDGLAAFKGRLNKPFSLDQPGEIGRVGDERSPYGFGLGITYPAVDLDVLLPAAQAGIPAWRDAGIEGRTGVCLEILHRLNRRCFELASAIMHTTGQAFMMAFQAGGPHAQDRGLEAVAHAYEEMSHVPAEATWQKQVGKEEFATLRKVFRIMPRGVGVAVGCSTFPTWNTYPGLFGSLATGNAVVVKPHHGAVLPLAITVEIAREVLREASFDPNLVTLVVSGPGAPTTKDIVIRPEVKIVDYTGGSEFGEWIEQNARQAVVFTEKAGVNSTILDGAADLKPVTANIAFSLCLYSGQMCTTPQNIFIPAGGIRAGGKRLSFDETAGAIVAAVDWLLGDPRRAAEILGAIQSEATVRRIAEAASAGGAVLRRSEPIRSEGFPEARVHSPLILRVDASRKDLFMRELFGPISYVVATESTEQSIRLAALCARERGAITCGVYSTEEAVLKRAQDCLAEAGVPISCNLTGQIYVNQAAAFSDYHVSGMNPAGNATLCDAAFVANRFRVAESRMPVTLEASAVR